MLKVTDNGVTITLQNRPNQSNLLTQILWVGIAIAVVSLLMAFKVLSAVISVVLILLVIAASFAWQFLNREKTITILSGGELRLTQQGFSHYDCGKNTTYQFLDTDKIEPTADGLTISNAVGQPLYHIKGFNDPKHAQIAQAVVQGKSIKTQGKAIKLQSS